MGRVRARVDVPLLASAAEALWYDTSRWPTFVDGLAHVAAVEGEWPRAGARVVWDSHPGGRGRVVERVLAHAPREGQEVEVEDEKLRGVQRLAFAPRDGGVVVTLELDYELKERRGVVPVVDLLFIRRPQRESLERTLRLTLSEVDKLARLGASVSVFMLGEDERLQAFVDIVARRSGGRVVAPDLDGLGAAVVSDYLRNRRR